MGSFGNFTVPQGTDQDPGRDPQPAPPRNQRQRQGLRAGQGLPSSPVTILALDTTSEFGSLAVRANGETVAELALHSSEGFAHLIFPAIEQLLTEAGVRLAEIDCFAAASGPGSFTGVRVGLSAVKGLAEAMGKPAAGVSNLRALSSFGNLPLRAVVAGCPPRRSLRRRLQRRLGDSRAGSRTEAFGLGLRRSNEPTYRVHLAPGRRSAPLSKEPDSPKCRSSRHPAPLAAAVAYCAERRQSELARPGRSGCQLRPPLGCRTVLEENGLDASAEHKCCGLVPAETSSRTRSPRPAR